MEKDKKSGWIRLPAEGEKCPVTGLYRTALSEILEERNPATGEKCVLSIIQRKDGASRGIRMINKQSLLDFLNRKGQAQSGLRWGEHIRNPDGYTVDEVVSNRELFQLFLSADDLLSDEDWEIGSLSTREKRVKLLVEIGTLVRIL